MMYDALYGRQSIEKKDSISVESQLEYCRYETHGDPYIEYADRGFRGCPACFLILKGVVISSHETNRFS